MCRVALLTTDFDMAYLANVVVKMLVKDATTGNMTSVNRRDLGFQCLVSDPDDLRKQARHKFNEAHGPDLFVRTCNLVGRETCRICCMTKASVPQVQALRDTQAIVRPLKPRRR